MRVINLQLSILIYCRINIEFNSRNKTISLNWTINCNVTLNKFPSLCPSIYLILLLSCSRKFLTKVILEFCFKQDCQNLALISINFVINFFRVLLMWLFRLISSLWNIICKISTNRKSYIKLYLIWQMLSNSDS